MNVGSSPFKLEWFTFPTDAQTMTPVEDAKRHNESLRAFRRGSLRFAVREDEVNAVVEWREPAPLPRAPEAIRGVVSVHGRMLTVLDLLAMRPNGSVEESTAPVLLVSLRGDEQLALAVDEVEGTIQFESSPRVSETKGAGRATRTAFTHNGADIILVNVKELFHDAMQGRERRHRRF